MASPEPLNPNCFEVILPSCRHTTTIILLHERGQTATACMHAFTDVIEYATGCEISHLFEHTRFVFPLASHTPAVNSSHTMTHQWFDMASESKPHERENEQTLEPSLGRVHQIIVDEGARLGRRTEQIFVGGFGQGAALALQAFLTFLPNRALAGFVGVSAWVLGWGDLVRKRAVGGLRETKTPILLLHSEDDERVNHLYTDECFRLLWELGYRPEVKKLEVGGHGLSTKKGVDELVDFVQRHSLHTCSVVRMQRRKLNRRPPLRKDEEDEVYWEESADETAVERDVD